MKWIDEVPYFSRQHTICGVPLSTREFLLLFGGWALFALIVTLSLPPVLRAALSLWGRL